MTPDQKKRIDIITKRWRMAEQGDNRKIAQAILDIGYLMGVIIFLEEELTPYYNGYGPNVRNQK